MDEFIKDEEVKAIVEATLADFNGGKNIDAVNIDSKPDKLEIKELLANLFRLVFPGYYRNDRRHVLPPARANNPGVGFLQTQGRYDGVGPKSGKLPRLQRVL